MKKQYTFLIGFLILVLSCSKKNDYIYKEVVETKFLGEKPKKSIDEFKIRAENDTLAFIMALRKYRISNIAHERTSKNSELISSKLDGFTLTNNFGEDITNIEFKTRDSLISNMNNKVSKKEIVVDHKLIKEFQNYFTYKTDEFSKENKTWVKPKSAPKYRNRNGLYSYFQTNDSIASNLRLVFQYHASEWLFIKSIVFNIDGEIFDYVPYSMETDHGSGKIWEWFDDSINTQKDFQLLRALANAKSIKLKLNGRQYYNTRDVSQKDILNLKRTLELYQAHGGEME